MRIIAGEWRGRRIAAPSGNSVRPTLDRVREAWMSIVHTSLPDARVLDLFAGSGALGLEALSRGAGFVDFVENNPLTFRVLRENVELLSAAGRCTLHCEDALKYLLKYLTTAGGRSADSPAYDVGFADPPYGRNLAALLADGWLKSPFSTIFGVEHESSAALPVGGETRKYGDSAITIYRR